MFRPLLGVTYIFTFSLLYALPLVVAVWLARRRVAPTLAKGLLAFGFGAATAYVLIDMEYHDLWRHGLPPVSYLLSLYLPYMLLCGAGGWLLGAMLLRPAHRQGLAG
jgi:hypothetical protein